MTRQLLSAAVKGALLIVTQYFGYLIAEYPSAFLIQRFPNGKFMATCCLIWAILMLCTAATHNFAGLAVCRFLMGMVEAVIFPICSVFTVMWWTTDEQPMRLAFWFNQVGISSDSPFHPILHFYSDIRNHDSSPLSLAGW